MIRTKSFELIRYKARGSKTGIFCVDREYIIDVLKNRTLMELDKIVRLSLGKASKALSNNKRVSTTPNASFFTLADSDGAELVFETTRRGQRQEVIELIVDNFQRRHNS